MNKEFCLYEQALALKELGFDEPCFAQYKNYDVKEATLDIGFSKNEIIMQFPKLSKFCSAPLYSQAFRWFREKYGVHMYPTKYDETKWWIEWGTWTSKVFNTFEEAELECLKKLIEIAKENK